MSTSNVGVLEPSAMIAEKKLPDVIKARHAEAVAKYQTEMSALNVDVDAALNSSDDAVVKAKAEAAYKRLNATQLGRSQQDFDPNNLPNSSLKPDRTRVPKMSAEEFQSSLLLADPTIRLAQTSGFDFSQLPGASDPNYLAATTEVVLTDDIKAKATELNRNPVEIYNWVRNNVHWQPTWGAIQDASHTLSARRGNAFDIASLTIALLRASGIPARYVHGTIEVPEAKFRNWAGGFQYINAAIDFASAGGIPITALTTGGQITKVRMEHIWVEAAVDFKPSRGAKNRVADTWVAMDPSFKQIEVLPGIDLAHISGVDPQQLGQSFLNSGSLSEAEGSVTGFNPEILQNAQIQMRTALVNYIPSNLPNATVGDVLGGRRLIRQSAPVLSASLPNRAVMIGARYAAVPFSLQQQITFAFGKNVEGDPISPRTFPWARLNNKQVTLSFRPATQADEDALRSFLPDGEITDVSQLPASIPAYLISVVPELKSEGIVLMSGTRISLGAELNFVFNAKFVTSGVRPFSYKLPAGSYVSVAVVAGSVTPMALSTTLNSLTATKNKVESGNQSQILTLTRERLAGDMFHGGVLGYYAQYMLLGYMSGMKQGGHHELAAGIGSFGYEPNVDYLFGLARSVKSGGAVMNIPIVNVVGNDTLFATNARDFIAKLGVLSSTLEHVVPEQIFTSSTDPGGAISAAKALSKASTVGQKIYQITVANQEAVLPMINHDAATMDEIRTALVTGKTVITHTNAVSVPGWRGAGYVLMDSETGEAAWKIGGGANGSFYDFCKDEGEIFLFCSIYVWVYECTNPANGDLSCSVGYLVAGAAVALLGLIGATLGTAAAALELYAEFDSQWYSDNPTSVLFGSALFIVAGIVLSFLFTPTFVAGLVLSLIVMFLVEALTTFITPSRGANER